MDRWRIVSRTDYPETDNILPACDTQIVFDAGTPSEPREAPRFFAVDPAVADAENERRIRFETFGEVRLSPSFALSLKDGWVLTDGFFVADRNQNVIADSFRAHGMLARYGFEEREPRVLYHSYLEIAQAESIDVAAVLGIQTNNNYFHWMAEALPRLILLDRLKLDRPITILVPELRPWMAEMLNILVGRSQFLLQPSRNALRSAQLIMPARGLSNIHTFTSHALEAFERLRRNAEGTSAKGRRLFISRTQSASRRIVNEDAVFEIASRHGFERVFPELMSVEEQICLFRDAGAVAGALGAGLANAAFLPEGAALIEFAPEMRSGDACLFANLAHHRRLKFACVVGATLPSERPVDRRDFRVPVDLAARAFESCR